MNIYIYIFDFCIIKKFDWFYNVLGVLVKIKRILLLVMRYYFIIKYIMVLYYIYYYLIMWENYC